METYLSSNNPNLFFPRIGRIGGGKSRRRGRKDKKKLLGTGKNTWKIKRSKNKIRGREKSDNIEKGGKKEEKFNF